MRRYLVVLAAAAMALLFSAGALTAGNRSSAGDSLSASPIPGCAPQCLPRASTVPANLAAGKYRTKYFFAGKMRLSFAKAWYSDEDSTGEFNAHSRLSPQSRVIFWEDVFALKVSVTSATRVGPQRPTAAGLLTWLQSNPNLTVSKPTAGKIGTIRARVVDIAVAHGAVNDDPGCPAKPCANFLGYPEWGEAYGIAGKAVSRFYFADVRYGGRQHLFVAVAEALGKAQLKAFLPDATKIFASVRVPATSA